MEFGLREVLIIVGFVVIAGILFDGYRRMRRSRMGEIGLPSEMGGSCEDDGAYYNGELPNGGARHVGVSSDQGEEQRIEPGFGKAIDDGFEVEPLEPLYDESVTAQSSKRLEPTLEETGEFGVVGTNTENFDDDGIGGVRRYSLGAGEGESGVEGELAEGADASSSYSLEPNDNNADASQNTLFEDDEMLLSAKAAQDAKLASHYRGNEQGSRESKSSRKAAARKAEQQVQPEHEDEDVSIHVDGLEEVIVLNLMAKSGEAFGGVELDKALTSCGFRFGDMNIYHRFEQHVGRGPLLFSLANVVEPGVFDPDNLDTFTTPGVCMFMKLPGPKRSVHSFELMVECGRKIISLLDGEMKDEHHSVMTQQTIEHYRQRVLDFDRKLLSHRVTQRS